VPPPNNPDHARGATRLRAVHSTNGEVGSDRIPSGPAKELDADRDQSTTREDKRDADGRELHLVFDQNSGRVHVQIRDRAGNVVRRIPPSKALSVVPGDSLG
jgi:uncharacterized FlaG/YvyC family protein